MKVEVHCSINSGQHDKGDIVDLPNEQAKTMIEQGTATKVGMATKPTQPKKPTQIIQKKPKPSTNKE